MITLHRLWHKVYPYTAGQVSKSYHRPDGNVLEMGSFAGGISFVLAGDFPVMKITIADDNAPYLNFLDGEIRRRGLGDRISTMLTALDRMAFEDETFDLVILRGAYFFIMDNPAILTEIYRLLAPGGLAFVGGGYGNGIPQAIIDEIAEESRLLNDRLGRRRITVAELETLVTGKNLSRQTKLVQEGGIWLEIRKPGTA